jgi:amino acid adenylation domain-containing protein
MSDSDITNNVIAMSLPSNAELALNVLAAMTVGVAAPFNPASTEEEVRVYLEDLHPRIMVTGESSPAARAARHLGVEVIGPDSLADSHHAVSDGGGVVPAISDSGAVALVLPTSGTTGMPKLVPLTHGNLEASAQNVAASLQLTGDDRCLSLMPYFHIHGLVAGLLAPLISGGSIVAAGELRPDRIRDWIERFGPTWYTGVPAMHRSVLDSIGRHTPLKHRLRFVRSSSSPLAPALMQELEDALGVPVIEAYGMTEGSHQVATNPLPPAARKPGTVGMASGTEIAILTEYEVHTEPARIGEVVVRGPSITTGYRDNTEANACAFHDGWFRTGDLGQLDSDGYLQLVGRLKEMINRGGEKIAPREIDEALLAHPAVALAVAFPYPHPTLGEDLAAVIVVRPDMEVSSAELTQFVSAKLSPYKIPRRVIIAERIPVGPTGKPQRHRMAEQLGLEGHVENEQPKNPPSALESIWGECLQLDRVPEDVDFFALGGDSLRALTLASTVEERLERTVPLAFFNSGTATLRQMEALIEQSTPAPEYVATPADLHGVLSFAERGVIARSMLDPDGVLFNEPIAVRIQGPLDLGRLQAAVAQVVLANEGLRSSFPTVDGRTVRAVATSLMIDLKVEYVDPAGDIECILRAKLRQPFDLGVGPLIRANVISLNENDHILMFTAHHCVIDGLAKDVVLEAVATCYRQPSTALPVTISPGAIASLQLAKLAAGELDEARAYWFDQLTPVPEVLDFPLARPHPRKHTWAGDVVGLELGPVTSDGLRALAMSCKTTPFAVFLAGLTATLSRLTGATDLVIGTPASNRHRRGMTKVVGMLANMLPLRVDVTGDPTFEDLIERVRQISLDALAHQEYPYEQMLEDIRAESTLGLDGLFRVVCQLRGSPPSLDFGDDITVSRMAVPTGTAKFDLHFDMRDSNEGITGVVEFNSDVFDRTQIEDICHHLSRLLTGACTEPLRNLSRLPLLDPEELRRVVTHGQGPKPAPAASSVVELIIEQARRTPEAPAVIAAGGVLTYQQLEDQTCRIASVLASHGVGRGDIVGIAPRRDLAMVAMLLGVLRSGAAYLPLDPSYPAARLQAMADAIPLRFLLYAGEAPPWHPPQVEAMSYEKLIEAARERRELPVGPGPSDVAYVLFTSGSTGVPKGVVVPHSAIVNLMSWTSRTFSKQELERVLLGTSLNFDFSVIQLFAPLAAGGSAVVVENVLDLRDLPTAVSLLSSVPAALRGLLDDDSIPSHVQTIVSGGEPLSRELAARLLALPQRPRLINIYGPTEATVLCCAAEITSVESPPPIGKAIDGALTLVVDRLGRLLPARTPGELWIGGRGLSHGYLNDASLTAERFVVREIPGIGRHRMYRTGDLVWADEDGSLHFVRRLDDQLKVRGMRVEPGDVEAALLDHPDVAAAAVYAVGDEPTRELRAAVTSRHGPLDQAELRAFASRRLPRHMVPRRVETLEHLPLSANGKIDWRALAGMSVALDQDPSSDTSSSLESLLLGIWERLLKASDLTIDSEFFDAGGDSLLVLTMLAEVEQKLSRRLPLAWFFGGPVTVRRLAAELRDNSEVLSASDNESASLLVIPVRAEGDKPPLFVIYANPGAALSAGALTETLDRDQPVYALAPIWTDIASRKELTEQIASAITEITTGLIHLAGHSIGGLLAYETAALLEELGQSLGALVLIDTFTPEASRTGRRVRFRRRVRMALRIPAFWRMKFWRDLGTEPLDLGVYHFPGERARALYSSHVSTPLWRPIDLLIADGSTKRFGEVLGWDAVHRGQVTIRSIPGGHDGFVQSSEIPRVARVFRACLDGVEPGTIAQH